MPLLIPGTVIVIIGMGMLFYPRLKTLESRRQADYRMVGQYLIFTGVLFITMGVMVLYET